MAASWWFAQAGAGVVAEVVGGAERGERATGLREA